MRPETRTLGIISEGKLKQAHAWESKLIAQSLYLGGDHTEIFCNKWQFFDRGLQGPEEFCSGTFYPLAFGRRQSAGWNFPVSLETAEMIQSHEIEESERRSNAIDPPPVTGVGGYVPPIKRVSPQLASRAEIIRRNTRNGGRLALLIQSEQLRMRPDIRAVVSDVDRDVAHDAYATTTAMSFKVFPLSEELKL